MTKYVLFLRGDRLLGSLILSGCERLLFGNQDCYFKVDKPDAGYEKWFRKPPEAHF